MFTVNHAIYPQLLSFVRASCASLLLQLQQAYDLLLAIRQALLKLASHLLLLTGRQAVGQAVTLLNEDCE